jgi:hypothetical protein
MTDNSDWQLQNSAQAIEFARECVRGGILINGGAAVAILALWSGLAVSSLTPISFALVLFAAGAFAAFIASAIGYWAQTLFVRHNARLVRGAPGTERAATTVTIVGIVLIVASGVCFVIGVTLAAIALPSQERSTGFSIELPAIRLQIGRP